MFRVLCKTVRNLGENPRGSQTAPRTPLDVRITYVHVYIIYVLTNGITEKVIYKNIPDRGTWWPDRRWGRYRYVMVIQPTSSERIRKVFETRQTFFRACSTTTVVLFFFCFFFPQIIYHVISPCVWRERA